MTVRGEEPYFSRIIPDDLPENWERCRMSTVCTFQNGTSLITEDRQEGSVPVYGSNGIVGNHNETQTLCPAIIIGRKGSAGAVNYSEEEAFVIDTAYFVDVSSTQCNIRWLYYLLKTLQLEEQSEHSAVPGINRDFIGAHMIPLPPISTQKRVATFLDHHTARIDALVEKKQRLLALLDEKRQTFITQAVTTGFDSTVSTKSTEVEWLEEIPAHWEPVRLKFLLDKIEQGWSPQCKDRPASPDEWGVLKAGAAKKGQFHEEENKILPSDKTPRPQYEIQQGDLLMNRASGSPDLLGSVALVPVVRPKLLLCDKIFRLHVREDIASPEFLSISLRSHPLRHQITAAISGADGLANNIPQAEVNELTLALPPLSEQKHITQTVFNWEAEVESLIQEIKKGISLLQEKRQALITAAVTGQIDISDWEPPKEKVTV